MEMHINELLINSLKGKNAHVDPFSAVEELSVDLAGAKGINTPHTIWQLLKHLNYWQKRFLHLLKGEVSELNGENWSRKFGPVSEEELQKEINYFKQSITETVNILSGNRNLTGKKGQYKSGYDVVQAMSNHISYHIGEIVQMRKILGRWNNNDNEIEQEQETVSLGNFNRVEE